MQISVDNLGKPQKLAMATLAVVGCLFAFGATNAAAGTTQQHASATGAMATSATSLPTSSAHVSAPLGATHATDNIWNCAALVAGGWVSFGAGISPWTALGLALSAREAGGCGAWMASAICRGSYFWGPFGTPFRQAIQVATQNRYNHC